MDFRRLRSFIVVAETLHFGRAAERLHVAQPALSQHIQQLEQELQITLLERDRRSVRLTPVGVLFLAEARNVVEQVERARLVAVRAKRGELGHVEVGHVGSIAYSGILSRAVIAFRTSSPDATLNLRELDLEPQIAALSDGRLDIAFVRLPAGPLPVGITTRVMHREPILVCLRHDHELAGGPVDLAALSEEPILATHLRPGFGFYDTMLEACGRAGFEPNIVSRSRQFATIVSLVASGSGVALVPASVGRLRIPEVAYQPLRDQPVTSDIAIAFREHEQSPAVLRFIKLCEASTKASGDSLEQSR